MSYRQSFKPARRSSSLTGFLIAAGALVALVYILNPKASFNVGR